MDWNNQNYRQHDDLTEEIGGKRIVPTKGLSERQQEELEEQCLKSIQAARAAHRKDGINMANAPLILD